MSLANPFWWKAVNVKFDFAAKVRFVHFLLIFCMDVRAHRARCAGCGWWQCEKHTLCKFVANVEGFGNVMLLRPIFRRWPDVRGFNKRASNLLANLKTDETALAKFASVASQQLDDLTHVSCSTSCAQRMLMLLGASLWRSWRPPADCCVNGRLGCKMLSSDRFMSGSPDVLWCSVAFFGLCANIS